MRSISFKSANGRLYNGVHSEWRNYVAARDVTDYAIAGGAITKAAKMRK
jgi:hypothetical protein